MSDSLQRGFRGQLEQALRIISGIPLAKNGIPGNQYFNPGPHCLANCVRGHATVDFDPEIGVPRRAH
jgi:hypothetical protein